MLLFRSESNESQTVRAEALEARASTGRARGLSLLNEAIATYDQLGMQRGLQQALALREHVREQQQQDEANAKRNVFRFDGKRWIVVWRGERVHVRKAPALHYIAYLLRHPGRWISIIDLQQSVTVGTPSSASSPDDHLQVMRPDAGEPALDARALRGYHARLRELRHEREEAYRLNDTGRVAAINTEREDIERQLRQGNMGDTIRSAPQERIESDRARPRCDPATQPSPRRASRGVYRLRTPCVSVRPARRDQVGEEEGRQKESKWSKERQSGAHREEEES